MKPKKKAFEYECPTCKGMTEKLSRWRGFLCPYCHKDVCKLKQK